ncbi:kinesin heavy chain, putative, partial [Perkinsus marinus ATCC 50983]
VLQDGCKMLHFRQTECNESSSRSHAVFTINYTSCAGRRSKLVLIDLAGSENVKRSKVNRDGVKEAGEINSSLSVLGRVVEALNSGSSHIPYRESLLTRLLQDSLGGSCKTCMIATINPERSEYRQTMNTLQFAQRMSKVVNRPKVVAIDN